MDQPATDPAPALLRHTATIAAAHVRRNQIPADELPALIQAVHAALAGVTSPEAPTGEAPLTPGVPVKRFVFPDYIICLEDGRRLKPLERHLQNAFGPTPEAYRERWGLPAEYPITAPNYAKQRSALAKTIGLGRNRVEPVVQLNPEGRSEKRNRKANAAA